MKIESYTFENKSVNFWWLPTLVGALLILTSLYCLINPYKEILFFKKFFGYILISCGLMEFLFVILNNKKEINYSLLTSYALTTFSIGLLLYLNFDFNLDVFTNYIGFFILFKAIFGISISFSFKDEDLIKWKFLLTFSILILILAIYLLINPYLEMETLIYLIGLSFFMVGCLIIFYSFHIKQKKNSDSTISEELKEKYFNIIQEIEQFKSVHK